MKNRRQLMIYNINAGLRSARAGCKELTLLCVALALGGCGKPAARPPEKALVRTVVVEPQGQCPVRRRGFLPGTGEVRPRDGLQLQSGRDPCRHRAGGRHRLGRGDTGESRHGAGRVEAGRLHQCVELGSRARGTGGQDSRAFSQTARDRCHFPAGTRCYGSGLANGPGPTGPGGAESSGFAAGGGQGWSSADALCQLAASR